MHVIARKHGSVGQTLASRNRQEQAPEQYPLNTRVSSTVLPRSWGLRSALAPALACIGLSLAFLLVTLNVRGLFPVDETRYVAVAWEMWVRHDFLTPYLNGHIYGHKPPLLFWIFQLGWWIFGVSDWWPRIVPALFALGNLWVTYRIALRLWPDEPRIQHFAPLVLLALPLWMFFSTTVMFDMLLTFFVLLAMLCLLRAAEGRRHSWLLCGLAIGFGVLTKGPVVLIYVLPAALSAPWWLRGVAPGRPSWGRWYAGILLSVLVATAIAFAWLIPNALHIGVDKAEAMYWHQTAGRVYDSFAHQRPWWWYGQFLPALLFPWFLWLPAWRAALGLRRGGLDRGLRLCLSWLVPGLLILSAVSGKQAHYLLPLAPACALVLSRLLAANGDNCDLLDSWLIGIGFILTGLALAAVPLLAREYQSTFWLQSISPWWGLVPVLIGATLIPSDRQPVQTYSSKVPFAAFVTTLVAYVAVIGALVPLNNLRPISERLGSLQRSDIPIAHIGSNREKFEFLGRLSEPLQEITAAQAVHWATVHPNGYVVTYINRKKPTPGLEPVYSQPYRTSSQLLLLSSEQVRSNPSLF